MDASHSAAAWIPVVFFMSAISTVWTVSDDPPPDISCDFEGNTMCGWINARGSFDQLEWTLHQGQNLSTATGPEADHTIGTFEGTFIYTESSPPVTPSDNDFALLMSPVLPAPESGTGCLQFWYHMYGSTTGSLSVYMIDAEMMGGHKVWYMAGEQGSQWQSAAVPIYHTKSFMFVIQGQIKRLSLSDMALDDIVYTVMAHGESPCRLDPLDARVQENLDIFYLRPITTPPPVTTYTCEECGGQQCHTGLTNVTCPRHAPVCFSHIRESSLSERAVLKGCISQADCEHGRISDLDLGQCMQVDHTNVTGRDLDCLFCCVGNHCNAGPDLIPSQFTWLEERTIPDLPVVG